MQSSSYFAAQCPIFHLWSIFRPFAFSPKKTGTNRVRAEKERLRGWLQATERAGTSAKTCLVIPGKGFGGFYHTFDSQLCQCYGLQRKAKISFFFARAMSIFCFSRSTMPTLMQVPALLGENEKMFVRQWCSVSNIDISTLTIIQQVHVCVIQWRQNFQNPWYEDN